MENTKKDNKMIDDFAEMDWKIQILCIILLIVSIPFVLFIVFMLAAINIGKKSAKRDKQMFDEWKKSDIISDNPSKDGEF